MYIEEKDITTLPKNLVLSYPGIVQIESVDVNSVTIESCIERTILKNYHLSFKELSIKSRKEEIKNARFLTMYFLKVKAKYTLVYIGKKFGGRHHTTVMNAIQKVKDWMGTEKEYRSTVERLDNEICALYSLRIPSKVIIISNNN